MVRRLAVLTVLLFLVFSVVGQVLGDDDGIFHAVLLGANVSERAVDTGASAQATALLSDRTLTVHGSFQGLASGLRDMAESPDNPGIVLQEGVHGQSDAALYGLAADVGIDHSTGLFHGRFQLTRTEVQQLKVGALHLKILTRDHPDGELRGQLVPLDAGSHGRVLRGGGEVLTP